VTTNKEPNAGVKKGEPAGGGGFEERRKHSKQREFNRTFLGERETECCEGGNLSTGGGGQMENDTPRNRGPRGKEVTEYDEGQKHSGA